MNQKDNPKVSILLPTYNGSFSIASSIQSVLNQDLQDWELLVIDDGSTDSTQEIVEQFANSDTRIRYIKNPENLGIQKTLNRGLFEARGMYIARIDDDDLWSDIRKLSKQINLFNASPDLVLIGTGARVVSEAGKLITQYAYPTSDKEIRNTLLFRNCFVHSSVVFKTSLAREIGGYPEGIQFRHVEDYALWLALGNYGSFQNIPEYSVDLMQHERSISFKNKLRQFMNGHTLIKIYGRKYPHYLRARFFFIVKIIVYKIITLFPERTRIAFHKFLYRQYMS